VHTSHGSRTLGALLRGCPPPRASPLAPPLCRCAVHPAPASPRGVGIPILRAPTRAVVDRGEGRSEIKEEERRSRSGGHSRSPSPLASTDWCRRGKKGA